MLKPNQALQNHVANAMYDAFSGGTLKIFGDSLIVAIKLPSPAFNPASNGAKSVSGVWKETATGSGEAATCKLVSSDGKLMLEGSVTLQGDGGDIELLNTNIKAGQIVEVSSGKGVIG